MLILLLFRIVKEALLFYVQITWKVFLNWAFHLCDLIHYLPLSNLGFTVSLKFYFLWDQGFQNMNYYVLLVATNQNIHLLLLVVRFELNRRTWSQFLWKFLAAHVMLVFLINGGINTISFENTHKSIGPCSLCMVTSFFHSLSCHRPFILWVNCVFCTMLNGVYDFMFNRDVIC